MCLAIVRIKLALRFTQKPEAGATRRVYMYVLMYVKEHRHTHAHTHTHTHTGEEEEEEEEKEASLPQQATFNGAGVDEENSSKELGEGVRGEELLKLVAGVVTSSFLNSLSLSLSLALSLTHTHSHTHTHTHTHTTELGQRRLEAAAKVFEDSMALLRDNRSRVVEVQSSGFS